MLRQTLSAASALLAGMRDLAWPPHCAFCGTALPDHRGGRIALCQRCWDRLPVVGEDVCTRCGTPQGPHVGRVPRCGNCPSDSGGIRETIALGWYTAPTTAGAGEALRRGTPDGDESDESDDTHGLPAHRAGSVLREAILALKFGRRLEIAPVLGALLAGQLAARPAAEQIDAVVPVPLHWRRQMERRFNQSAEIATEVTRRLGRPLVPLLVRTRYTSDQGQLPRISRLQNVRDAFALSGRALRARTWLTLRRHSRLPADSPSLRAWLGGDPAVNKPLAGCRVLLVDDVMTTGATLAACARALRKAGAKAVFAAVVARAG